ncbi:MAG TPA: Ig-like domain-containing protein, partial [Solirubrobacteraceae bacterium]|nr:Ig-like domain-containing protein [Solirubrobacteraceae bacterium]
AEPLIPVQTLSSPATGGGWSVAASFLSDGSYTAVAEQTNAETSERGTAQATFTVDTTAPLVSLNAVITPTNSPTPTFTGSAGELSGDSATVNVTVYAGASVGGTVVTSGAPTSSGGAWSYTTGHLSDGTYTAQATQRDQAGNVGTSAAQTFTVDTTKPKLSIGTVATPTNNSKPSFGGTAGTVSGASSDLSVGVVVYAGSAVGGTVAASGQASISGSNWSYTVPSTLPDGTYTVQAAQADQAGNETRTSPATFVVDTTRPAVTLTPLATVVGSERPAFSGAAGTASGDSSTVKLTIYDGTAASGSPLETIKVTQSGGGWSTEAEKSLSDGTYTAIAAQSDSAGNEGVSSPSTFTVKTKGPAVSLDALSSWTNDRTPSFSGGLGTEFGDLPAVTLEIFPGTEEKGAQPIRTVNATDSGAGWSVGPIEALPDGTYTAEAKQFDQAKHEGVSIARTFTVDTVAPVLSLAGPSESTGIETVSGAAGAAPGDRREITIELFQGTSVGESGQAFETLTVNAVAGAWSATFASLPSGPYAVIARQSDEAGNVGTSDSNGFTVVAPAAPTPAAAPAPSSPSASFTWVPATPVVGQSVSLVSSSTDPSSTISSFAWDVAGNGQFAAGGSAMTTSFATAGTHTVSLRVTDGNGLSSTATESVKVAAAAPKLMQPFPIVRIAGSETSYGVKVRLLTVQAPLGAKVAIACVGGGCKTKAESRVAKASSKSSSRAGAVTLAFARFERPLRAGASLQIRVTQPGEIGKFTSFAIRRKRLPVRTDACLAPASSKPAACPST